MFALIHNHEVVEYPVHAGEIKRRHPNISFGDPFVPPPQYCRVSFTIPPQITHLQNVVEGVPQEQPDGWKQTWIIQPASAEEIKAREQQRSLEVRDERDDRLSRTDWTQMSDTPVDSAVWQEYRQALRDIPDQEGFPWDVEWPTPPQ